MKKIMNMEKRKNVKEMIGVGRVGNLTWKENYKLVRGRGRGIAEVRRYKVVGKT